MAEPGDRAGEIPLQVWGSGAQPSNARLRDGVVYREAGPWSPTVLALLRHLEDAGFAGAPRIVGTGFAADGREMLSYVPGASPQPYAWSEDVVAGVGMLLRELHAAAATFIPPPDACWKPWFGRSCPGRSRSSGIVIPGRGTSLPAGAGRSRWSISSSRARSMRYGIWPRRPG